MDTISLIIITVFITAIINGIVSNLIFLRYQKRIEESFVKSKLEYETKFVRNHAKMVETLETIYQKYSEFRLNANRLFMDRYGYLSDQQAFHKKTTEVFEPINELFDYFVGRSIYLPELHTAKIKDILSKSKLILTLVHFGFMRITKDHLDDVLLNSLDLIPTMVNSWWLDIDLSDEDKFLMKLLKY